MIANMIGLPNYWNRLSHMGMHKISRCLNAWAHTRERRNDRAHSPDRQKHRLTVVILRLHFALFRGDDEILVDLLRGCWCVCLST